MVVGFPVILPTTQMRMSKRSVILIFHTEIFALVVLFSLFELLFFLLLSKIGRLNSENDMSYFLLISRIEGLNRENINL